MRTITKKNAAFGITGVAAATLAVAGFAAPAMADTTESESTWNTDSSTTTEFSEYQLDLLDGIGYTTGSFNSPLVIAPEIGVGDVASGDIASGNAVASGNDVTAPVTAPVASGNDVTAPVASGNDTAVGNGSANGNQAGAEVSDVVDSSSDLTSGISGSVSDIVDSVDVDGMVEDVTGSLDLGGLLD
jgi:hypothetical protein